MKQKNKNEILLLRNYCNFLLDLGLNLSFSQENPLTINQGKINRNIKSVQDVDSYIKEWQIKNDFQLILRNNNMYSKNFLLLSEEIKFVNYDLFRKNQPELLEKMFASIGKDIDDFFIINVDFSKLRESHINKINEILKLYFTILNPKTFIDMCSDNLNKFLKVHKFNLNCDYFKIPSVSNIVKNQSLKRIAWTQLKLLKVKLNEF